MSLQGNPVLSVDQESLSNLRAGNFALGGMDMTADSWSQALIAISQSKIRSLVIFSTAISFIPRNFFNSFHNHSPYNLYIFQSYSSRDGVDPLAFRNLTKVHSLSLIKHQYYYTKIRLLHRYGTATDSPT